MATYTGGSGNDSLTGSAGSDVIYGNGGNDTINAGGGADLVYGGDGADSINAGAGTDTVYAGNGADTVTASNGYDIIYGEAGNDNLSGGSDMYDDLYGGLGDDSIYGGGYGQNWVFGGEGNDLLFGGAGEWDYVMGGSGNDTAYGGNGADTVLGGTGNDSVFGGAGNDFVTGDDGADTVDGGIGADTVEGGQGNDLLSGGDGNDLIRGDIRTFDPAGFASGSTGPQTSVTFTNTSTLTVNLFYIDQSGTPQFYGTLAPGQSWIGTTYTDHNWMLTDAASGAQLAIYEGGINQTNIYSQSFDDTIVGGQGADTIYGDFGNDLIDGGTEADSLFGGIGDDTVFGGDGADVADLGDGNDRFGDWSTEGGNDTIYGGAGDDSIIGGSGDDWLYGGLGHDTLSGGAGNDTIYGGAGNDLGIITDDHNADFYDLGEEAGDADLIWFANYASTNGVSVTFSGSDAGSYAFAGGLASGGFAGVEGVGGTNYNDSLDGSADTDGLWLWGDGGRDTLIGGSGNDELYGGFDHDSLSGGAGDDALYGQEGDDRLSGGAGNDTLYGGAGADSFVLIAAGGDDLIQDFDMALSEGRTWDRLDVSDLQNPDASPVRSWDVAIAADGAGGTILTFPEGETLRLSGVDPALVAAPGMLSAMGVPCLVAGTLVMTPQGPRRVERLQPGDLVSLADGGQAPLLWVGARHLGAADLALRPALRPVRIKAGRHGALRDFLVSPQHALRIEGIAGQGTDSGAALIRAGHLARLGWGARVASGIGAVSYHHLLLPSHAIILAEGVAVESLYPGPMSLSAFLPADRAQLLDVLRHHSSPAPGQGPISAYGPRCLPLLGFAAARWLRKHLRAGNRMSRNQQLLQQIAPAL